MHYTLEIIDQLTARAFSKDDTIESDQPIPIPLVSEVMETPSGRKVVVVHRNYSYLNSVESPRIKVQLIVKEIP
jgi:hypothetical protein